MFSLALPFYHYRYHYHFHFSPLCLLQDSASFLEQGILSIISERDAVLAQVASLTADNAALRAKESSALQMQKDVAALLDSRAKDDKRFVELLREFDSLKAERSTIEIQQAKKQAAWEEEARRLKQDLEKSEADGAKAKERVGVLEKTVDTITASNKQLKAKVEELSIAADEGVIALQLATEEKQQLKREHEALEAKHTRLVELAKKHIQQQQQQQQQHAAVTAGNAAASGGAAAGRVPVISSAALAAGATQRRALSATATAYAPQHSGAAGGGVARR